jgi:hypothetical protein
MSEEKTPGDTPQPTGDTPQPTGETSQDRAQTPRPPLLRRTVERFKPRLVYAWQGVHTYSGTCKNCIESTFFLLAIAWALYVFVYTDWYKPSTERSQVVASARIEKAGQKEINGAEQKEINTAEQKGKAVALTTTIKVKNNGKAKLKVLSAHFNIIGYKIAERVNGSEDRQYQQAIADDLKNAQSHGWEMSMIRYFEKAERSPLQSGNLLLDSWLEPGEEYERVFNVYVPEGYDFVRLKLDTWVARDAPFIKLRSIDEIVKAGPYIDGNSMINAQLCINNCTLCFEDNWEPLDGNHKLHKEFVDAHGISHSDSQVEFSLW